MKENQGNISDIVNIFPYQEEVIETIVKRSGIRIERIVSGGQASAADAWYDQKEDEWVLVLDGHAGIVYEDGREILMNKGDYLLIPAGQRHRVNYTSKEPPCIWLAIFFKSEENGK